ncbi:MAG: hypothetical protein ACLSCV_10915 [Acutalibacteraceae bacterium]
MQSNKIKRSIVHPSGIIGPGDYGRTHLTQLVISYLNGTLTACKRRIRLRMYVM